MGGLIQKFAFVIIGIYNNNMDKIKNRKLKIRKISKKVYNYTAVFEPDQKWAGIQLLFQIYQGVFQKVIHLKKPYKISKKPQVCI